MKSDGPKPIQSLALWVMFFLLCALSAVSLTEAAASRAFWLDEYWGVQIGAVLVSWRDLFLKGPNAQGSLHPLYYVIEKLWLIPWTFSPQRWWNLNLFFRLSTISFYSLSGGLLFIYATRFLSRAWPERAFSLRLLVAAAMALFFYNVQFAQYYAIEARPYSLWLFLSMLHFLLTLDALDRGWRGKNFFALYSAASLALCLTASPGIFQIGASFVAIQMAHRSRWAWLALIAPVLASAFYMIDSQKWGYSPGGILDYLTFMKEVAFKSFHARNVFAFLPVLALSFWQIRAWRSSRLGRPLGFYIIALLGLSLLLFAACLYKHFLLASRQYIYLIPLYMFLYFSALFAVAGFGERMLRKRIPQIHASWILSLWAAAIVSKSVPDLARRAWALPEAATRWRFYGENFSMECGRPLLVPNEYEWEALNRRCRQLKP